MRSFILFGFLAAILGISAIDTSAQGRTLRVDIPFDFTVGKTTLPAGQYRIVLPGIDGPSSFGTRIASFSP